MQRYEKGTKTYTEKYLSWVRAYGDYRARRRGFAGNAEYLEAMQIKEMKKISVADMLKVMAGTMMGSLSRKKQASKIAAGAEVKHLRQKK